VSRIDPAVRALRPRTIAVFLGVAFAASSCHTPAPVQPTGYAGTWVMTLGTRVFIVLTIDQQGDRFEARIQAPSSFGLPPAGSPLRYSNVQLPVSDRRTSRAAIEGDHLRLVVADPKDPTEPDQFDFVLAGHDRASLTFVDVPVAPMPFVRHVGPAPAVATDWDSNRTYALEAEPTTPNAEMAQIYDADQRVRQDVSKLSRADWEEIAKSDAERRTRTRALLDAGALHAAGDYRKAAFVFQHGDGPDDFLLAHTLALVAVAKGDQGAAWIAAATLDRYLQSMHHPQIYGTQFLTSGARMTQGTYNRALVSDALRIELGVPTIAAQLEQMKTAPPPAVTTGR
jgi:hypothetical protein